MKFMLPVERTPGTRGRPGMSVGIDWTSHALHCAEDSVTGSRSRFTIRERAIAMKMVLL